MLPNDIVESTGTWDLRPKANENRNMVDALLIIGFAKLPVISQCFISGNPGRDNSFSGKGRFFLCKQMPVQPGNLFFPFRCKADDFFNLSHLKVIRVAVVGKY